MKKITYDNLPETVGLLLDEVRSLKDLLVAKVPPEPVRPPATQKEVCEFFRISKPTLAKYEAAGFISSMSIGSRKLYDLEKLKDQLSKKGWI
jgi:hypothetical protein